MTPVHDLCARHGITPRTLIEVGAAHPFSYRLVYHVEMGYKVILVEANPRLHYCLSRGWDQGDFSDSWPTPPAPPHTHGPVIGAAVQVVHAAVVDEVDPSGTVKLYERNASSFIGGSVSPAKANDGYVEADEDAYEVPGIRIDQIDDGQVDVLLADVEGCEWYCIKHLVSRPRLIILEMAGGSYVNPFKKEIDEWMSTNGYVQVETDHTDTAWVREAKP